jgi:hypothetical protein
LDGDATISIQGEQKMSGGYLKDGLEEFEHQVVIFTFKGPIDQATCREWNQQIKALKESLGPNAIGVTLAGEKTPESFRRP